MGCCASSAGGKKVVDPMNQSRLDVASRFRQTDISEDYTIEVSSVLGTGYNGPVRKAIHRRTGRQVAVKTFQKLGLSKMRWEFLVNEVNIYLELDHPHIARLLDVYETGDQVHIVIEFCAGKELYKYLVKDTKQFSEKLAADTAYMMLLAVQYLHGKNIVHRDLKLENWLYADVERTMLKLIDFGFSKTWDSHTFMHRACGSLQYMAPEVFGGKYTYKVDIWGLGVICYMMLSGKTPFPGHDEDERIERIKSGQYSFKDDRFAHVSKDAKDFVQALMQLDVTKRLGASEALKHPWIAKRDNHSVAALPDDLLKEFQSFASANHFKRAALTVMAYSLTSPEISDLQKVFTNLDHEHTGVISHQDFVEAFKANVSYSHEEIEQIFASMEHSGFHHEGIYYSDFVAAMLQTRIRLHENLIREAFVKFDVDRTGFITAENMQRVLGNSFGGADASAILDSVDSKHAGKIDYDQFLHAVQQTSTGDKKHVERIKRVSEAIDQQFTEPVKRASRAVARPSMSPAEAEAAGAVETAGSAEPGVERQNSGVGAY